MNGLKIWDCALKLKLSDGYPPAPAATPTPTNPPSFPVSDAGAGEDENPSPPPTSKQLVLSITQLSNMCVVLGFGPREITRVYSSDSSISLRHPEKTLFADPNGVVFVGIWILRCDPNTTVRVSVAFGLAAGGGGGGRGSRTVRFGPERVLEGREGPIRVENRGRAHDRRFGLVIERRCEAREEPGRAEEGRRDFCDFHGGKRRGNFSPGFLGSCFLREENHSQSQSQRRVKRHIGKQKRHGREA
ncbi:uncharacterized protein G2W53_039030 [Senna tora]|uniref:Uncharacterized protein n=1 Tax=Senna tora TaxID=362788 RepID=A0A834W7J9_9FABA|nr:uncharacterized protein G2W53_039030 [Senna tora]